jgi:hypothetical protein
MARIKGCVRLASIEKFVELIARKHSAEISIHKGLSG